MTGKGKFTSVLTLFGLVAICPLAEATEVQADNGAYVGGRRCAECHQAQYAQWQGSHHDLAMQEASERTVLGDFSNVSFTYNGVTSKFYRRDGKFFVRTDGPDGKLHDYRIQYTFGVDPLQQYLIAFPDGRLQALGIAWDARPKGESGQRWFHLYPNDSIDHRDELHWTGAQQTWNFMCAECHSTNTRRNYNLENNSYDASWSEIDVSCEACHGPGGNHLRWAKQEGDWRRSTDNKGLAVALTERQGVRWVMDKNSGNARHSQPRSTSIEIEMCARCHSRRASIWGEYRHGRPLLDSHLPQLLTEDMYFADGQIQDEVYVYGSFLQSKMYQAGVTCSDCHEPHTLKLRAPGNGVCFQCHAATKYDSPGHHRHKLDSKGAQCVECHMPERTYMVVDPRRDHSLRVPRPDLSATLHTPNACSQCHADKDAKWAAAHVEEWYGHAARDSIHYGEILQAARAGSSGVEQMLIQLAKDQNAPAIARATALYELGPYLSRQSIAAVVQGLQDGDPLVRRAALLTLERVAPQARVQFAVQLLNDPVRGVRIEAARLLAPLPLDSLTADQRAALESATKEYIRAQQSNADRPESYLNLGLLYLARRDFSESESAYEAALKIDPRFVPAYVNLADLYRIQGKNARGAALLRDALVQMPNNAELHSALGLALVRQQQTPAAVDHMRRAAELAPTAARYTYLYAVALNSTGKTQQALAALSKAHQQHPNDRDILYALVTFNRDTGNVEESRRYARKLAVLMPDDPVIRALAGQ